MSPGLKLALWIIGLVVVAFALPGLGVLGGLTLIGLAEFARRKKRASFVSFVLGKPSTPGQAVASLVLGAVLLLSGGSRLLADWGNRLTAEREVSERAAATAKRQAALAAQVPAKVAAWRAKLSQLAGAAESPVFSDGDLATVDGLIADATALASGIGGPAPAELSKLQSDASSVRQNLAARAAFETLIRGIGEQIKEGKDEVAARHWGAADQSYAAALQDLDSLEKSEQWLTKLLPVGFDTSAKRREVSGLRSQIAGRVAAETRRTQQAEAARQAKEAKQAAYAAVCGEKPTVSGWDGALIGLESTLKETADDPDSIEVKNCTEPLLTSENCWISTCDVRGKNAFGAKILKRMTFSKSQLGFQEVSQ